MTPSAMKAMFPSVFIVTEDERRAASIQRLVKKASDGRQDPLHITVMLCQTLKEKLLGAATPSS